MQCALNSGGMSDDFETENKLKNKQLHSIHPSASSEPNVRELG